MNSRNWAPSGNGPPRLGALTAFPEAPPALQLGVPTTCPGSDHSAELATRLRYAPPADQLGGETINALTFQLDHSVGAGHEHGIRQ